MLEQAILVFHVLAAILIVVFILLQQGKGADAGASFGAGASQTVLGVEGGGNLLTRVTAILAAAFFISSLTLGYFAKQKSEIGDNFIVEMPAAEAVDVIQNDEVPALEDTMIDESSMIAEDVPVNDAEMMDAKVMDAEEGNSQ